jgi:S-adenosylmethionine hydrolase
LAAIKGAIYSRIPDVVIIDISHDISHYNIMEAAFVVKNCWKSFPEGSVHMIAVESEASVKHPHMLVVMNKQYFIAADTGIFSLIFEQKPDEIYEITTYQESDIFTFPARDVFVKVACHLALKGKPTEIGQARDSFNMLKVFNPVLEPDSIRGVVIYVDGYENVVTNITQKDFAEIGKGRKFTLHFRGEELHQIHTAYSDVPEGEILAVFGATSFLEIAINKGNAAGLLGLEINESVRIAFNE